MPRTSSWGWTPSPTHLGEELPVGAAPVTADDVLDMHEFLSGFEGDMRTLMAA